MKKFLQILIAFFIALIIFYLTQLHFEESLFSDHNAPFTISGMIATVGILFSGIFLQLGRLK